MTFIEDGTDGWDSGDVVKLNTGFGVPGSGEQNEGLPNALGEPRALDLDQNGTADIVYAGDLLGNLFRFDMRDPDPANWSVTRVFQATYSDGVQQPITTQPIAIRNPQSDDGVIVMFATGSFITEPDGTSTEIQSLYGIWDRFEDNPPTAPGTKTPVEIRNDLLVEQTITNVYDDSLGALRKLSSNQVDYSPTGIRGWYIDFDPEKPATTTGGNSNPDAAGEDPPGPQFPGERAVRNLQLRGGFLFVNTVIPRDPNSCLRSPGGFALALNPATGGEGGLRADIAFDLNNDAMFDDQDLVGGDIVAGLRFDEAVPTNSSFIGSKRFTQLSDRTVDIRETNTDIGTNAGRLSWAEVPPEQ